ncbi:MAG: exodeoxyribonuclease V subunit alpha [Gammaproteobacteria bacterium]|nr:exodeoxyribonuclease V subunit alpha [Gammaproteobacteria bacterium]
MYKTFYQCQSRLRDIKSIDYFLARQICKSLNKEQDHLFFHSIMATSEALRNGHTCLKLDEEAQSDIETVFWQNLDENQEGYHFPILDEWHEYLSNLSLSPEDKQPLVYENNRLYLRRYWQFENELGAAIHTLLNKSTFQFEARDIEQKMEQARQVIERLFPHEVKIDSGITDELDWQKIAVANALLRQFTIIAGGPGTGKTFTVTKILAALQSLSDNTLKIAMVAPTGKAAQRLNESIQKAKSVLQKNKLTSIETLNSIPDTASTLHRLLGVIHGSHSFRFNETRKLPFDLILVDEISMIDLPLMTRLMRAIDEHCQIIMLGDADQLPSVAAGSILADLAPKQIPGYTIDSSKKISELTGCHIPVLDSKKNTLNLDHLTVLQKSHRFDGGGEIGQLARQVIGGNANESWILLKQGKEQIERVADYSFNQWIEQMVDDYYVPLFENKNLSDIQSLKNMFEQLNQFRFLAATRLGEQGVYSLNEIIEQYLRIKGLITSRNEYYPGRPIMVTENHYNVGLYNGDTGFLWLNEQGKLQAVFPDNESIRWLSLGRLPKVETVYAMTIHKTQGSEFSHVGLVLPEKDSLILSRELLYTGITRASQKLSVWSDKSVWNIGVRRKVQRYSGLGWKVFNQYTKNN